MTIQITDQLWFIAGKGGGEKEGESGMEDFWEVTWFLVEKEGGGISRRQQSKKGGGSGL